MVVHACKWLHCRFRAAHSRQAHRPKPAPAQGSCSHAPATALTEALMMYGCQSLLLVPLIHSGTWCHR